MLYDHERWHHEDEMSSVVTGANGARSGKRYTDTVVDAASDASDSLANARDLFLLPVRSLPWIAGSGDLGKRQD